LIRRSLIWTRSTGNSKTSHHLKWGEGSDNFADHSSGFLVEILVEG
jgi:hypothetical protein